MIRIIDIIIGVYLGCGLLVILLDVLLATAVWGHRHGWSLVEAICNSKDSKLTFHDYACIILTFVIWPCTTFIVLQACFGFNDALWEAMDRSEGYSEAA